MSAVDLIVDLPPPDSSAVLNLSPSAYLQHPDTLTLLRQKSSLLIGPQTQKNFHLEPPPIQDDRTIMNYFDRVNRSVFKDEISVRMPGDRVVDTLNNSQIQITAAKEQIKVHEERIFELEIQIDKLIRQNDEARLRSFGKNTRVDTSGGGKVLVGLVNTQGKYADADVVIDNVKATDKGQGVVGIVEGLDLSNFFN